VFVVSLLMFIVMFLKDNLPRLHDIGWLLKGRRDDLGPACALGQVQRW